MILIGKTILRIAGGLSNAKRDERKKSIEKFFHEPLEFQMQRNVLKNFNRVTLRIWKKKDKLDKLDKIMEKMQIKLDTNGRKTR